MAAQRIGPLSWSAFLAALATWAFSERLQADESLRDRIDRLAAPYLENQIAVGMTIGVLDHDRQEFFSYGLLSAADNRAPDQDTIYEIGSTSKVFTGVLLADAVVRGLVRLDEPAADLLPPGVKMPAHGKRAITLLDLSTHVSGLPRLPDNLKPADANNPYADYSVDALYDFLNHHTLARAPGEKSEYSNLGVGLLGHLLALRQQTSYEQLLRERIATPLKMADTTIALAADQRARLAPPHDVDGRPASNWDLPTLAGAGAIRSTAADMLRFAEANLSPPSGESGQAIELAWKVHQKALARGEFAMGLGWHIARDGSTRWHNGQTGGYHSMLLISREHHAAVVLLTNTATMEVDPLAEDIMRMLAGTKVEPRTFEKSIEVPLDVMRRYVGRYELLPSWFTATPPSPVAFTVAVEDGKLLVGLTGQPTVRVYARSETDWFYKVVKASLSFHVDENGRCDSLVLVQNGLRQTAQRVE